MLQARLDERHELAPVAREAARHERGAERHGEQHGVDRRLEVGLALLRPGADVGGGGELSLGEPIDAVVLDDVEHVEVAADRVAELPEADRERVAVAGDADVGEAAVSGVRAHRNRGHATVHGIEAVSAAHEVGGGLGGAADPGELHHVLRLEGERPARFHDRGGDRVVPAARAQRRERALVIAPREPEGVLRERRMRDLGFGDESHVGLRC